MSRNTFFLQWGAVSALVAVGMQLLLSLPELHPYRAFSWGCLVLFALLAIAMYFAGFQAARSSNKNDFTNVAMGFSGGKIFLSAILILIYKELAQPETRFFILPFFGCYLAYTIFEVYFMMRLGRMKP